jgi:Na+-driven multidrug efflux pump
MIRFLKDPNVINFGSDYLRIVAFNFVAAGIVFLAEHVPRTGRRCAITDSASRLVLFALPALLLQKPGFDIKLVWYLSVGSHQACINLLLLRRELHKSCGSTTSRTSFRQVRPRLEG